jgi:hypothetical protein
MPVYEYCCEACLSSFTLTQKRVFLASSEKQLLFSATASHILLQSVGYDREARAGHPFCKEESFNQCVTFSCR